MRHVRIALSAAVVLLASAALADEAPPDFHVVFTDCKALGTPAGGGETRLSEASEYSLACWRRSRKVECVFTSDGQSKNITYAVDVDAPPLLTLVQGQHAGDFVTIDVARNSASSITRTLVGGSGMVAKVCSGVYATADMVKALRAKVKRREDPASMSPPADPTVAPELTPEPASTPARGCCKVCTKGCPCGDSCISCSKTCRKGPGCAC